MDPLIVDDPRAAGRDEKSLEKSPGRVIALRTRVISLVAHVALVVLGGWIAWQSLELQLFNALGVGPGLFPFVSGLLIAVLAGVGAATEAWHIARHDPAPHEGQPVVALFEAPQGTGQPESAGTINDPCDEAVEETWETVRWSRFWVAVVCVIAFVLIVDYVGFVIAIAALTVALLTLTAQRPLLPSALTAVGVGVAVWWGFGELLDVRFPEPSIPFLAVLL